MDTTMSTPAATGQAAIGYLERGWAPIDIPYRSKNPNRNRWQKERHTEADLQRRFNGRPRNVGVLLGAPSDGLIDIDLDHMVAVEMAPDLLPPTASTFGRRSKPRSHYEYQATGPIETKKWKSKVYGTLVELRSTGCQTVFPGSVHECGEPIEWVEDGSPAKIDPNRLTTEVAKLANAVMAKLGVAKVDKCFSAMMRLTDPDNGDGSLRLLKAARLAVEHDLTDQQALDCIGKYAHERPFAKPWGDDDILRRVRDAEKKAKRGKKGKGSGKTPTSWKIPAEEMDAATEAEAFLTKLTKQDGVSKLRFWRGMFLHWSDGAYREVPAAELRARAITALNATFQKLSGRHVSDVVDQLKAQSMLTGATAPPAWLGEKPPRPWRAEDVMSTRTGLVHLPSLADGGAHLLPPTPAFFTTTSLAYGFDPDAPDPRWWLKFLDQLWPDDAESINLLQEWFGYCLTPDTAQQKILMLIGPRRSGKGTIARIQTALVGPANVAGPTLASLAQNFGLQPLLGKSLAIISDARLGRSTDSQVVAERLLSISGEDALTVDRKYLEPYTGALSARFMLISNELPRIGDASGALASRMLVLKLSGSFYGREDHGLTDRLKGELPGILSWAIEGWKRLRERGHFVPPASSRGAADDMEKLSSPVAEFVGECCEVGPSCADTVDHVFKTYQAWAMRSGMRKVADSAGLGRDLKAAFPAIHTYQHRASGVRIRSYKGIQATVPSLQ